MVIQFNSSIGLSHVLNLNGLRPWILAIETWSTIVVKFNKPWQPGRWCAIARVFDSQTFVPYAYLSLGSLIIHKGETASRRYSGFLMVSWVLTNSFVGHLILLLTKNSLIQFLTIIRLLLGCFSFGTQLVASAAQNGDKWGVGILYG